MINTQLIPILIPLIILEFGLLIYVIYHIMTHDHYKRGNRAFWIVLTLVLMNFIGPILYIIFGKED